MQVVTQQGEEVFFKIKRSTKLSKLKGAYANKVGKDVASIRCVSVSRDYLNPGSICWLVGTKVPLDRIWVRAAIS